VCIAGRKRDRQKQRTQGCPHCAKDRKQSSFERKTNKPTYKSINTLAFFRTRHSQMAFDRPLESDRVDDLSFLSVLSRAPVIGSIMWFLGGQMARDEEEKEMKQQRDLDLLLKGPAAETRSPLTTSTQCVSKSALRKSDTLSDCANALDEMTVNEKPLKRQRKNISWSDEGGKDLVEFIGQVSQWIVRCRRAKPVIFIICVCDG
jgi:hypothetical protein